MYNTFYGVGAKISSLISIYDGLIPDIFRQNYEKTQAMGEKMDGNWFISNQNWHFPFIVSKVEVLVPICILTWRVSNYLSRQEIRYE